MAMGSRTNNAQLVADCAQLGYLHEDWRTLDPTYGKGRWWTDWSPTLLRRHDLVPSKAPDGPMDFTRLDYLAQTFEAVVFDPPYKLNGTKGKSGPASGDESYGVDEGYTSIEARHDLMRWGISECLRVLAPRSRGGQGGYLLVKCQDQVSSGKVQWQTRLMADHAEAYGRVVNDGCSVRLVDELHVRGYRKQPEGRSQKHARRDYSTLLVFQKKAL